MGTDAPRRRAYVSSPIPPEEGLLTALKWCFQCDPTAQWDTIGFLVPHPGFFYACPALRRLRARGALMTTASEPAVLAAFTGPLIVYRPDPRMLEITDELTGVLGTVAVAEHNDWLQPWVTHHRPQHLGGDILSPT